MKGTPGIPALQDSASYPGDNENTGSDYPLDSLGKELERVVPLGQEGRLKVLPTGHSERSGPEPRLTSWDDIGLL